LHDRSKSSKRAGAHYVVKTPSGGIPASIGDEPGSADCNIHIRDGDPKELRDTTRAETVYNFGPAIPGDTILIAHRDAWGDLWAGEPSSGGVCEELDLQPGSYMANSVGIIAPGASGLVYYYGQTISALNHSLCAVGPGFPVGLHITPQCVAFFVPCTCCGYDPIDPPPPDEGCEACEGPFVACVNGTLVTLDYGQLKYVFFSDCELCPPTSSGVDAVTIGIGLRCVDDKPELYGFVTCNSCNTSPNITPFTIDLSSLCEAPSSVIEDTLTITCGVFTNTVPIKISKSTVPECPSECDGEVTPSDPPSSPCCEQSLYLCIQNVSELLPVDGGNTTFDVSVCCGTEASLEVTLSCDPSTGVITMAYTYTAGMVTSSGTANLSAFCTSGAPRIITLDTICFLQMLVSTTQFDCPDCLSGGTTITTPPPPVTPPPPGP
jgi:hypothetical protein